MADLIRIGLLLDHSGVATGARAASAEFDKVLASSQRMQQGVTRSAQALGQVGAAATLVTTPLRDSAVAADLLRDRFVGLRDQFRLGQIGAAQYAAGLRTLKTDIASLTSTTALSAESQVLLARTGQQTQAALLQVSGMSQRMASGMSRAAFGVVALSQASQSGIGGLQGLTAAMLSLSLGNPVLMGVLAGLAGVAAAYALIKRGADEAARASSDALDRMRRGIQGLGVARQGLPEGMRPADLRRRIAALEGEAIAPDMTVPVPRETVTPGSMFVVTLNRREIDLARQHNAALQIARDHRAQALALLRAELVTSEQNLALNRQLETVLRGQAEVRRKEGRPDLGRIKKLAIPGFEDQLGPAVFDAKAVERESEFFWDKMTKDAKMFNDSWVQAIHGVEGAFERFFAGQTAGFREFVNDILAQISRLLARNLVAEIVGAVFPRAGKVAGKNKLLSSLVADLSEGAVREYVGRGAAAPAPVADIVLPGLANDLPKGAVREFGGGSAATPAPLVVNQSISFNVAAMDGASVERVLQAQRGTIARIVSDAVRQSRGYRAALAGL